MLELDGVEKRYGGLPAVRGVTMRVDAGEIVALVGPNGAGKTTLLETVIGLETPTAGRIRFMDTDVTRLPPHRTRRAGIAMALQNPRTFATMSVRENVDARGAVRFARRPAHAGRGHRPSRRGARLRRSDVPR